MAKWAQGNFTPTNPQKYVGKHTPRYRSGWELTFMQFCDNNPNIISWASEPVSINYTHPLTGKMSTYMPDFIVVYMDKNKKKHAELIEIKPSKQTTLEAAGRSMRDQAAAVLNAYKWQAAQAWCSQNGLRFRVLTENDIFHQGKAR